MDWGLQPSLIPQHALRCATAPVIDSPKQVRISMLMFNDIQYCGITEWGENYVHPLPCVKLHLIAGCCQTPWLSNLMEFFSQSKLLVKRVCEQQVSGLIPPITCVIWHKMTLSHMKKSFKLGGWSIWLLEWIQSWQKIIPHVHCLLFSVKIVVT